MVRVAAGQGSTNFATKVSEADYVPMVPVI